MALSDLSSRAIVGEYYLRLAQNEGAAWVPRVSMLFQSDQPSETYKWLGQAPLMREWLGGRLAHGLAVSGITIENKLFEATLEVYLDDLRRDKTGQVMVRIAELARRTNAHWAKLLATLIEAGEAGTMGTAYDGQFFFDTDHVDADSGSQSNDITYDVTTPTAPTAQEMQGAILTAVQTLIGLKDDTGEPMNEDAMSFLVMVPVPFIGATAAAINNPIIVAGSGAATNTLTTMGGFTFEMVVVPRLTWTTKFAVFRTDGQVKPFIRQEETPVKIEAVAEGSEEEFMNRRHLYGVSAQRNVGFGLWQEAVLVTLI